MLDLTLLRHFCDRFYGYGVADAPHWFISMEEGGGKTEAEINERLAAWNKRGQRELEDVAEYHEAIGQSKWFSSRPPIQRTWAAMIRILLAMAGQSTDVESVRRYQRDRLARTGSATRLSPLFPLPAQSLDHWHYPRWSEGSHFANRQAYRAEFEAARVAHLASAINQHAPSTVAFFGTSYLAYWSRIAGVDFHATEEGTLIGASRKSRFVICRHPATKGIANEYFVSAGRALGAA